MRRNINDLGTSGATRILYTAAVVVPLIFSLLWFYGSTTYTGPLELYGKVVGPEGPMAYVEVSYAGHYDKNPIGRGGDQQDEGRVVTDADGRFHIKIDHSHVEHLTIQVSGSSNRMYMVQPDSHLWDAVWNWHSIGSTDQPKIFPFETSVAAIGNQPAEDVESTGIEIGDPRIGNESSPSDEMKQREYIKRVSELEGDSSNAELLNAAVAACYIPQVRELIPGVGDINGSGALVRAAGSGCIEAMKLLLDAGADVNARDEVGRTALMHARSSDIETIRFLIAHGADVNAEDKWGSTPLIYATYSSLEAVKLLVESGADVNHRSDKGNVSYPLFSAAREGKRGIVRFLVEKGADLERDGPHALFAAADGGHTEIVELLLQKGVPLQRFVGDTALGRASSRGHMDVVKAIVSHKTATREQLEEALINAIWERKKEIAMFLLENGADANARTNNTSALKAAAWENQEELFKVLIDRGAEVDAFTVHEDQTALMDCAAGGHLDGVKLLLQAGAKLNRVNRSGHSALMLAAARGQNNVVEYLLKRYTGPLATLKGSEKLQLDMVNRDGNSALLLSVRRHPETAMLLAKGGADVTIKNKRGQTAYLIAMSYKYMDLAREIAKAGGANLQDAHGSTALLMAARENDLQTMRELLRAGANPDIRDESGYSALTLMAQRSNLDGVRLLVEAGADINLAGLFNVTALFWAMEKGDLEIVPWLIEHGADVNAADDSGRTVLMMAVRRDAVEIARLMIDKGADTRAVNKYGETAAAIARKIGNEKMLKLFPG